MANARERKDVWKMNAWDPVLLWYARAVATMKTRQINVPTSWRYQAAIHEYIAGADPLADPADVLPSAGQQKQFWNQCQHNSWFFLPWHRMYLSCFEQVVAATVVQLGGPADWSLPYWNYSDPANPNAKQLPSAFYAEQTPDGVPNPLRVLQRNPGWNTGKGIVDDDDVDIRTCLKEPTYVPPDPAGGNPGFGGPRTRFHHSGGNVIGKLDRTPHGSMHGALGGWMGRFNTAALDPIFWLHHANIDRLWTVWRKRSAQDLNPTDPQWLSGLTFEFNDAAGNVVSFTCDKVVDSTAAPLDYMYEDESDPLGAQLGLAAAFRCTTEGVVLPEMVGATDKPIALTGEVATARFSVRPPAQPALAAREQSAAASHEIYLNIENITGSGDPVAYSVYLNLPEGANPAENRDHFAGLLPMFGLAEATRSDENNSGSGLHYAMEVGDVIRRLRARNAWDPNGVRVTFVPKHRRPRTEGAQLAASNPIRIGRVSLYYK